MKRTTIPRPSFGTTVPPGPCRAAPRTSGPRRGDVCPRQQPVLDRWVAGELDEKAFLKESHWFENWGMDFTHYRDLLHFARKRRIPLIALNAEKDLVGVIRGKPPEQLSAEEQARLPELDLNDPYQRSLVTTIFGNHSAQGDGARWFHPCTDTLGRDHGRVGGPLPGEPLRPGDPPARDRRTAIM